MTVCVLLACSPAWAQLPAFPGAEGAGAYAVGGRYGDVYHVTTLSSLATTPGSFAYGIAQAPAEGRTIVFDVSGYIHISGTLTLNATNITIAGQTAPGDGIGFKDGTFNISASDIIIRHVRFRDGNSADSVDLDSDVNRCIMDHCDVMLSNDENLSSFSSPPDNFTFQWSMNAWGMESHSCGGLWDQRHATCHHSLWSHNHTRNPKARPTLLEWINNVTFDWDIGFIMGDSTSTANWKANVRGNYFVCPPGNLRSVALEKASLQAANGLPNFSLYLDTCAMDANGDGVLNVSKTGYALASGSYATSPTPFAAQGVPVTRDGYLTAYKKVLSAAGPLRLDAAQTLRDELNTILVQNVVAQKRHHVSSPSGTGASNGGFGTLASTPAPTDSDRDGMPDFWEVSLGSNINFDDHKNAVPAGAFVPLGYTLLEEYLQFLAMPHGSVAKALASAPTALDIDLRKYTCGFTNRTPVVYTLSNVVNGTATLTNSCWARFAPPVNFYGRAWFDFTVTDGDGSTWKQTFAVLVSAAALPRDLLWKGDGISNTFDTNALSFLNGTALTAFSLGDTVTFDDTGSTSPQVNITGTLMPGTLTVNASKNYTLGGSGSLSGGMSLSKSGSGTLLVNNSNTFSGGTTVDGCTVQINSGGSLGSGTNTLLGGTFVNSYPTGTQPGFANPFMVPEGEIGTITLGNRIALTGAFSGGGTLNLVAQTTVARDDIKGNCSAFSGTVNFLGSGTVRMFINGGAFTGFDHALTTFNAPVRMDFNDNSDGNTFLFGALSGTHANAIIGNTSAGGAPTLAIGARQQDTSFAGQFQGSAHIAKVGSGQFVVSGASTHTGITSISNGTLVVTGSFSGSPTVVANGGTLAGTGRLGAGVTVLSGGRVSPGLGSGSQGTLTTSNTLTLTTPTLLFDLSSSPTGANDAITMQGGKLAMSGVQTYLFNLIDGSLSAGTYKLIEGATDSSAWSGVTHNLPSSTRQTFSVFRPAAGSNPSYVRLTVTGNPAVLVWSGTNGSAWNVSATTNWLNNTAASTFFNLDSVRFDDTSTNGTIIVSGNVQPALVTVTNNTRSYTLGGGEITGSGALVKSGTAQLTLTSTNSYSGGTVIRSGTVYLANDIANQLGLGSGTVTLQGGTLAMFSDTSTYNSTDWSLSVPTGMTGRLNTDARCYLHGALTGGGTLDYYVTYVRTELDGDWSDFTGQINVLTDSDGGDFRINNSYGYVHAALNLNAKVWAYHFSAGTVEVGELSGAAGSVLSSANWIVGARNTDATFAGTILGSASLTKVGSGIWTLSGAARHTGTTFVEAGTLRLLSTASITNTSLVTVRSGATLSLQGTSLSVDSITVDAGALLTGYGTLDGYLLNEGTMTVTAPLTVTGDFENSGTMNVSAMLHSTNPLIIAAGLVKLSAPQPGLYEGSVAGAFNTTTENPKTATVLTTRCANVTTGWVNNTTMIYSGTLWNRVATNVPWTFAESFDDNVLLTIDGVTVLNNNQWYTPTLTNTTLTPGPHAFELRIGQGDGGAGPSMRGWWTSSTLGVGYDPLGRGQPAMSNYQALTDPGDGTLLTLDSGGVIAPASSIEIAAGAVLDLGGTAQTWTGLSGSGLVTNGALTITGTLAPGGVNTFGTLTLATSASLSGTLLLDVAEDGSCDLLKVQGSLTLSGAILHVQEISRLTPNQSYAIARCTPGELTGSFASTNLSDSRWTVTYDRATGIVRLIRIGLIMTLQ